jgi:DmsE family decaheme c-type cytochrome
MSKLIHSLSFRDFTFWKVIGLAILLLAPVHVYADDDDDDDESKPRLTMEQAMERVQEVLQAPPSDKGADTCLKCHDEDNEYPVFPMFKTKHANAMDSRTPFAGDQCETCHGPGGNHQERARGDEEKAPILNFGKDAWTPAKVQNQRCLTCHENHQRIEWQGGSHEFNDVACASCHRIHVARDPMLVRKQQASVCFSCHVNQRARFMMPSHHPVREGQLACSECHNVHGDTGADLQLASVQREKCTGCHAEKRGPFLWEHEPAAEDCTLCHATHGSVFPALLKKRPPQLCQQCHAQAGHPSVSYNGSTIPTVFLGVKGCLNCHANTHGSNHPSGASALR